MPPDVSGKHYRMRESSQRERPGAPLGALPLSSGMRYRQRQNCSIKPIVGGDDAVLVIDDTAVPKKGEHSVGVADQYASALGKTANCQTLVSLTLARGEVPVMIC